LVPLVGPGCRADGELASFPLFDGWRVTDPFARRLAPAVASFLATRRRHGHGFVLAHLHGPAAGCLLRSALDAGTCRSLGLFPQDQRACDWLLFVQMTQRVAMGSFCAGHEGRDSGFVLVAIRVRSSAVREARTGNVMMGLFPHPGYLSAEEAARTSGWQQCTASLAIPGIPRNAR
jgi:hypothetical protein